MKFWTSTVLALAVVVTAGCDSIPFIGGGDEADTTAADMAAATTPDTAAVREAAPDPDPAPPAPRQPAPRPVSTAPAMDEPWTPTDTGTVAPGMSREQVVSTWGVPVAERQTGAWTFLYYRNGCEVTCGTFDVVFLENGQVVDAIVRWDGHRYAGVSSSPPGREALPTPPNAGSS